MSIAKMMEQVQALADASEFHRYLAVKYFYTFRNDDSHAFFMLLHAEDLMERAIELQEKVNEATKKSKSRK